MNREIQLQQQPQNSHKEATNALVFSYLTQRNLIGFCGMLLPVALAIFPARPSAYYGFEPSISDYFYTNRGDILVVMMSVLGVFLFTYKGYTIGERILTAVAGICALGVAFVPTKSKCDDCYESVHTMSRGMFGRLFGEGWHLSFACIFLLCLAIMSLKYFTRSYGPKGIKTGDRRTRKGKRNIVYIVCGWTMIVSVLVLAVYFTIELFRPIDLKGFPIIYVFETIAVEAFGLSWITKGETLWPDKKHSEISPD